MSSLVKIAHKSPWSVLIGTFACWKILLFLLVAVSPGPGYDTSTSLLISQHDFNASATVLGNTSITLFPVHLKLARWDAIYFASIAERGYLYEQEWAFGFGHTQLLGLLSRLFVDAQTLDVSRTLAVGVALSHLYHLLSVLVLYAIGKQLCSQKAHQPSAALLAALLHVFSPAGAFLSAPYAEPLFSFLNFLGCHLYITASSKYLYGHTAWGCAYTLSAGVAFGLATTNRSNGLLSGLLFLYDLISLLPSLRENLKVATFAQIVSVGIGGLTIASATIAPQFVAYSAYCGSAGSDRPWCHSLLPSIFGWVQTHYWNVGFLRYWTLSNLPLFLLAAPMLNLLFVSSYDALTASVKTDLTKSSAERRFKHSMLRRLSLAQGVLALMALTTYHVQIITRLSSGSPLWYIWLAESIRSEAVEGRQKGKNRTEVIIKWMIIYALVQGGLFASFLPPA